jgi:hypothetical protein
MRLTSQVVGALKRRYLGLEQVELLCFGIDIRQQVETMRFCPGRIRSFPAKASQVSGAFGVEHNPLLLEPLLLVPRRTDFALRVDDTLPGDSWPRCARAQGRQGVAHLSCSDWRPDHGCDLPVGGNPPRGDLPDDLISTLSISLWQKSHLA